MEEKEAECDTDSNGDEEYDRSGDGKTAKADRIHVEEYGEDIHEESSIEPEGITRDAPVFREDITDG